MYNQELKMVTRTFEWNAMKSVTYTTIPYSLYTVKEIIAISKIFLLLFDFFLIFFNIHFNKIYTWQYFDTSRGLK